MGKRKFENVYQLKITLMYSKPPIWRRIQIPEDSTFRDLHNAIQDVMEWEDSHLHDFYLPEPSDPLNRRNFKTITDLDRLGKGNGGDMGTLEEAEELLSDHISIESNIKSFEYVYDFGDNWVHKIVLEKVLPVDKEVLYPVCIAGKRACPPEDCGGMYGYLEFLEILNDPKDPEYEEHLEWAGGPIDPESFYPEAVIFRHLR